MTRFKKITRSLRWGIQDFYERSIRDVYERRHFESFCVGFAAGVIFAVGMFYVMLRLAI